jgi:hypothetical protein
MLLAIYKGPTTESVRSGSNTGEGDGDQEANLRIQPLHLVCLLLLLPIEFSVSLFLRLDKLANLRILQERSEENDDAEENIGEYEPHLPFSAFLPLGTRRAV